MTEYLKATGTKDYRGPFFALFGTWLTYLFWTGMLKGLAVLFPTLRDNFQVRTWSVGWMITIVDSLMDIAGPLAAPLGRRFGVRAIVMISGVMTCISFILASMTSSLAIMTVVLASMAGPAFGVATILCREMTGRCFGENSAAAYSFVLTGSAVAFATITPLTQLFLDTYGWRGTMLLLGAIWFHLVPCGALFTSLKESDEGVKFTRLDGVSDEDVKGHLKTDADEKSILATALRSIQGAIERLPFTTRSGFLVSVLCVGFITTHYSWVIYFVPHAQSKGLSPVESVNLTVAYGVARIAAGLCIVPSLQWSAIVSRKAQLGIALAWNAAYFFLDPFLLSFWSNLLNVAAYACSSTVTYAIIDAFVLEVVGPDRLGDAFGWIALIGGSLRIGFLFVPGLIFDLTGSYTWAFIMLGGVGCIPLLALLLLILLQRQELHGRLNGHFN